MFTLLDDSCLMSYLPGTVVATSGSRQEWGGDPFPSAIYVGGKSSSKATQPIPCGIGWGSHLRRLILSFIWVSSIRT